MTVIDERTATSSPYHADIWSATIVRTTLLYDDGLSAYTKKLRPIHTAIVSLLASHQTLVLNDHVQHLCQKNSAEIDSSGKASTRKLVQRQPVH